MPNFADSGSDPILLARRLYDALAAGDVGSLREVLHPSFTGHTTEGLPLVVPEAMAAGLPIVTTSVGGLPTVVDEGHTGLLVPVDDKAFAQALGRLIDDRALAKRLGAQAREVALARYSSDRMVEAYLALYASR